MAYALNLNLSATAPLTIVDDVAANAKAYTNSAYLFAEVSKASTVAFAGSNLEWASAKESAPTKDESPPPYRKA